CRDYHDPGREWGRAMLWLALEERSAQGAVRSVELVFDNARGDFHVKIAEGSNRITVSYKDGAYSAVVNGRHDVAPEELFRLGLTPPEMERLRNRYAFTYGLPMNLDRAQAAIAPQGALARIRGAPALAVTVTFPAAAGSDRWLLYLDPATCALSAYAVHPARPAACGELALLDGEIALGELRLPATRRVYSLPAGALLRTETITKAKRLGE
ncbi:MAG: DUF6503 family protein, partial [Planctomycetes bacterium]|nr:DUF6503 family protein [Planctomycetota bacterium]